MVADEHVPQTESRRDPFLTCSRACQHVTEVGLPRGVSFLQLLVCVEAVGTAAAHSCGQNLRLPQCQRPQAWISGAAGVGQAVVAATSRAACWRLCCDLAAETEPAGVAILVDAKAQVGAAQRQSSSTLDQPAPHSRMAGLASVGARPPGEGPVGAHCSTALEQPAPRGRLPSLGRACSGTCTDLLIVKQQFQHQRQRQTSLSH
jgi:hypothetical protein